MELQRNLRKRPSYTPPSGGCPNKRARMSVCEDGASSSKGGDPDGVQTLHRPRRHSNRRTPPTRAPSVGIGYWSLRSYGTPGVAPVVRSLSAESDECAERDECSERDECGSKLATGDPKTRTVKRISSTNIIDVTVSKRVPLSRDSQLQLDLPRPTQTICEGDDVAQNPAEPMDTEATPCLSQPLGGGPMDTETLPSGQTCPGGPTLEEEIERVAEVHPECDPDYIRKLLLRHDETDRVSTVTFDLFDTEDFPTRAERELRQQRDAERLTLANLSCPVGEFLQKYPDPKVTFYDQTVEVDELYVEHVVTALRNEFRMIPVTYIRECVRRHGYRLAPTYQELKGNAKTYTGKPPCLRRSRKYMRTPRQYAKEMPEEPDRDFYWELLYVKHEQDILDLVEAERLEKQVRYEAAREAGTLHTCAICLQEEVLEDDMVACSANHLFCNTCVRNFVTELLGQCRGRFPCLDGECQEAFPLARLQRVLSEETYRMVVRRAQMEEVLLANIPDIVTCPFCPYAVVIPDESSRVFHCENPDCLKDSCRSCKSQSHLPLTCQEFRDKRDVTMRNYIEARMAEAMIRVCKCGLRFVKEMGCNYMTCTTCQAHMCYVCRQFIDGYQHFRKNKRCQGMSDMRMLHEGEIKTAAEEADRDFREEHPELADVDRLELFGLFPSTST